jgi:hypothetical protein
MKKVLIILAGLFILGLTGCDNKYSTMNFPIIPDELKDCKFYNVQNEKGQSVNVVRCPNSATSTTYQVGKTRSTTVVIDGVEYIQK